MKEIFELFEERYELWKEDRAMAFDPRFGPGDLLVCFLRERTKCTDDDFQMAKRILGKLRPNLDRSDIDVVFATR